MLTSETEGLGREKGVPRALTGLVQQHGHPSPAALWGTLHPHSPAEQGRHRSKSKAPIRSGRHTSQRAARRGWAGQGEQPSGRRRLGAHLFTWNAGQEAPLEARTPGTQGGWAQGPPLPGPSSPEGSSGRRLFLATSASAPKPRPTARPARKRRRSTGRWCGDCPPPLHPGGAERVTHRSSPGTLADSPDVLRRWGRR